MGRKRANLKGLTCSLTTPLFSQRPERTPGGHAPETRRGLRKDEVNGSAKRRRRHFERPLSTWRSIRRRELSSSRTILEGHRALIKRLKGLDIARIVFEATGLPSPVPTGDGRGSACLGSRSIPVRPDASPRPQENLAKTDRCDALACSAWAQFSNSRRASASKTVEALRELVNARDALIKDRVAALNRQAIAVSPLIKRQLAQRLRQIDGQDRSDRSTPQNAAQRRLGPVPAVRHLDEHSRHRRGDLANVLVVETPELGRLEHAQAASLVGLAPLARDSGKTHGKRSIRGGRPRARQALYMPALNAIRCNPEFKTKYEAMVKAGTCQGRDRGDLREVFILANALIRDRRKMAPANPDEHGHYRGRLKNDRVRRTMVVPLRARNRSQPRGRDAGETA